MDRELKLQFIKAVNKLEGKQYLASVIAFKAAPTIRGKKPSSLLCFKNRGKDHPALWRRYGREICNELELQHFELKNEDGNVLVLFYNKIILEMILSKKTTLRFLKTMGYGRAVTLAQKLQILKQRFKEHCPHEVGVFLGIPVGDVVGFIKHKGQGYLMCRYWKVYGNQRRAELIFRDYDRAKKSVAIVVVSNDAVCC